MANNESTATQSAAPKKRGWLKKLLFVFGGLLALLVIAWFVCTSEAFFKGVVLPRVGKAMNATLTADAASLSPFSQVSIRGLKLQTTGSEPLLTATEIRARYSLTAILGGNLKVDEVLIDSPVVTIVQNADGTMNTDALTTNSSPSAAPQPSSASAAPPQVDLKQFHLKNATLRYLKHYAGGTRDLIEVTGLDVTLDDVKNGAAGKLAFALAAKAELNPPDASQRGSLQLKHDGKYAFTLGPDLLPTQISGSDRTDITQASGILAELANAGVDMTADMSPTDIKGIALTFRKAGTSLGELRASGPFDSLKREGKLTLTLAGVDRKLLNLAGAMAGLDFGSTAINSTNLIEITRGGAAVNLSGRVTLADFQVTSGGQTTPTLQFNTTYALALDSAKSSAVLQQLNLNGTHNGQPLLKSELSSPMTFNWGNTASTVGDSTLVLTLTSLNLADWKPFLGGSMAGGRINATAKLLSQQAGKKLGVNVETDIQNLALAGEASAPENFSTKVTLATTVALQEKATQATGKLTLGEVVRRSGQAELRLPATTVDFDVTQTPTAIELKQVFARLAPSVRAKNELSLAGRVDMAKPEAITGGLKLTADALDLTSYYELFASSGLTATTPAKPAPTPAPSPEKEPEAMTLPFQNFTFDATIGHIYLHEVDIANLTAGARLDGGKVSVQPLQCTLNGAPVKGSAQINLGVAGWQYEFNLDAPNVPLAPLVNSFQPERKGQVAGTATAFADLKGAGITGANLQKNLTGKFDLVATNLQLSLSEVRTPVIKTIINIVVAIPDAIRDPGAAVGNLLSGLTGAKRENSSFTDELMKSPLNQIVVHGTAGNGRVELQKSLIESTAFRGEATGAIELASVLTNSTMRFPVNVSLSKSLSDKIGLTPANTPTNAVFVALPEFVKMGGTLGLPKPDVKYLVLAQMALKSSTGILGNIGGAGAEKVGGALNAVGGLLGGSPNTNAPAGTNAQPATPAADLIRGIGGLFGGQKKTATNNPAPPAQK